MPFGLGKCKNSMLQFKAAGAYSLYGAHSVNYLELVILQGPSRTAMGNNLFRDKLNAFWGKFPLNIYNTFSNLNCCQNTQFHFEIFY